MKKITFIDLEAMGSRMAKRLIEFDRDVTVFNRTMQKIQPLKEIDAKVALSVYSVYNYFKYATDKNISAIIKF